MSTSPPMRYVEHELTVYRQLWRTSVVQSFLAPILFLAAIGGTVGKAVDRHGVGHFGGATYIEWLAPGLMAANAMQVAIQECLHPVLGGFKWTRNFIAAASTPLRPADIALGRLVWVGFRAVLMASAYLLVAAAFGAVNRLEAVLAIPVAALTGMAFACPASAWAATRERDDSFSNIQRFGVLPLFLFSGAFFPISQLPALARPLAYVLPLWHGVVLCRALALGHAGLAASIGHVAVLVAYGAAGTALAARAFTRRLQS